MTPIRYFFSFLFISILLFSCNVKKEQNYYNDAWFVTPTQERLRITLLMPKIISQYNSFIEFDDKEAPKEQKIIFTANDTLRDFKYTALQLYFDHDIIRIVEHRVKFQIDELLPEHPFVVNWMEIGTMPHAGISFLDKNNQRRYFSINANNADPEEGGTAPILLIEYPGVSFINVNDPILLSKLAMYLILQIEGRDNKDPAAAEELSLLTEAVNRLSEADRRIYNSEIERFYTGQDNTNAFEFYAGYYRDVYIDHLRDREIMYIGSGLEQVYFYSNIDLFEFKILAIGSDENFNFFTERIIFSVDVLSFKTALEYSTYVPQGIPAEAVSFRTADGKEHVYLLQSSGLDGSLTVIKLETLLR
ncbi:MAG: hypothetical protein FWD28_05515 [Treponema sp.]|nr:hypothetical protein [Treponema sp.]